MEGVRLGWRGLSREGRGGAWHAAERTRPCTQRVPPSSQKIALQLKATLENVTNLRPVGEDFRWYLKMKCGNCGEISEKWQYIRLMRGAERRPRQCLHGPEVQAMCTGKLY
uniref:CXXC motif containing zinc binding protein n=1 Tax=Mus musculus TaxID=10090 RepID=D6REH4_MOUSE